MKQISIFLFIIMVLIAGTISVPRCYVLQPDCPERGTFKCPFLEDSGMDKNKEISGCPMAGKVKQQEQENSVPSEKMAQFKIEQFRHLIDINIDAPAEYLFQEKIYPLFLETNREQSLSTRQSFSFYPPSLSILLQSQSFLV
jgi:hypothetical protein